MTSMLTMEERALLRSLGCRDRKQALEVIHKIIMAVPVRSELFRSAVMLNEKLEHEHIDYAAEMKAE